MAQGDVFVHDQFLVDALEGATHNFSTATVKCALIKSLANGGADPAITDADPCWGAGGTTNYSSAEVTAGGNYTAGGATCATPSVTLVSGKARLDFGDPASWAKAAGNPTNARWGIVYNDSATNKNVLGYVDLGSDFDMTGGALTITWNANGFVELDQA